MPIVARFHVQQREVEELLQCFGKQSLDHREPHILQTLGRECSSKIASDLESLEIVAAILMEPSGSCQMGGWHTFLRCPGCCIGRKMRSAKKDSEAFGSKRGGGASYEARCQTEFQATVPVYMHGRILPEVSGAAPTPKPCSSDPAIL